jgi:hypothetical protein
VRVPSDREEKRKMAALGAATIVILVGLNILMNGDHDRGMALIIGGVAFAAVW